MNIYLNHRGITHELDLEPSRDDPEVWQVGLVGDKEPLAYFEPMEDETVAEIILDAFAVAEAELEERWLAHTRTLTEPRSSVSA